MQIAIHLSCILIPAISFKGGAEGPPRLAEGQLRLEGGSGRRLEGPPSAGRGLDPSVVEKQGLRVLRVPVGWQVNLQQGGGSGIMNAPPGENHRHERVRGAENMHTFGRAILSRIRCLLF
eukprot:5233284-Pyramimonas_sp.AAC.1